MFERLYQTVDCHTHLMNRLPSIECLHAEELVWNHESYCVLSLEANGPGWQDQNALCIANKRKYPHTYALGGLNHAMGDFQGQAEALWDIGVDGFKMIEGKPQTWVRWNITLDDPCYDDFYKFCQSHDVPILLHTADPDEFWDINKVTPDIIARGWYYDEKYPSKEDLTQQTIRVLKKFPGLKMIMAHFFFLADDLPRVGRLFDEFPGLYFDITPGAPPYEHFARDVAATRDFFTRYKDRILYGTDSTDMYTPKDREYIDGVVDTVTRFLNTSDDMVVWDLKLKGICAPEDVRKAVFKDNFIRIAPHRQLNAEKAREYFRAMLASASLGLNDVERNTIQQLWG